MAMRNIAQKCAQKQALDLYPVRIGLGIDYAAQTYNVAPSATARIILVGTGTTVGNVQFQATESAAFAQMRNTGGDWCLWPQGTTVQPQLGVEMVGGGAMPGGSSDAFPCVFGTYDPADPYNAAKYNNGAMHFFDYRGLTATQILNGTVGAFYSNRTANQIIWKNLGYLVDSALATYSNRILFLGGNKNKVVFDGLYSYGATHELKGGGLGVSNNTNYSGIQLSANALQVVITSAATVATVSCFTSAGVALTHNANPGQIVTIGNADGVTTAYNGQYIIQSTPTTTTFTYNFAGTGGVPATATGPKFLAFTLAVETQPDAGFGCDWGFTGCSFMYGKGGNQGNMYISGVRRNTFANSMLHHGGWWTGQSRQGVGTIPQDIDVLRHNSYWTEVNDKIKFVRSLTSWDAINNKVTGAACDYREMTSVRDPIPVIIDAVGNDTSGNNPNGVANGLNPNGGAFKITGLLQVNTDDAAYPGSVQTLSRGWGPVMVTAKAGSFMTGNVSLNNGDQPDVSDLRGYQVGANGQPVTSFANNNSNFMLNWCPQDYSALINTTRVDNWNISAATNTGTNLNQFDASLSGLQAGFNASLARNMHTTFRLADPDLLANITPVTGGSTYNNNKATEELCMTYIGQNWKKKRWAENFRRHMLSPMGR